MGNFQGRAAPRAARRTVAILALVAMAAVVAALEWPIADPRPSLYFGSSVGAAFAPSMRFVSDDGLVIAADEGELAFVQDSDRAAGPRLPSTIGSYVIVEHGRGIAAVYSGISPGTASSYLKAVKKGSLLGKTGSSGMAGKPGLGFSLFDRAAGRWVNPLLLLPALADKTPPLIRSASLIKDGRIRALGETKSLPQGLYQVVVDVADPLEAASPGEASATFFLRLVVDGVKVGDLSFDVLASKQGHLLVGSENPRDHASCFRPDGQTILATRFFARGRTVIQILARDYAGNERQATWTLTVE